MYITYAHKDAPHDNCFRQLASDTVPAWAVNVREVTEPTPLMRLEAAVGRLPKEFQDFVRTQAYDRGHSAGEDEVASIAEGLVADLLPCVQAYIKKG